MVSISDRVHNVGLDKKLDLERIAFANEFENIGYGFLSVSSKKKNKVEIKIQIDPSQLRKSGYEIKSQFKDIKEPYGVMVKPG